MVQVANRLNGIKYFVDMYEKQSIVDITSST